MLLTSKFSHLWELEVVTSITHGRKRERAIGISQLPHHAMTVSAEVIASALSLQFFFSFSEKN